MKPEISVIVPVYNVEKYVRRCIDSLLNQTFLSFEVIIIDDGSTDNSPYICDCYSGNPRVRVIHQNNCGLADARNVGLKLANGKYISFVDGDDFVDRNMLSIQYNNIQQNNADIAVCGYKQIDENMTVLYTWPIIEETCVMGREVFFEHFYPDNKLVMGACVWNKLYKKELFDTIHFPSGKIYEDSLVFLPIINRCNTIVVDPQVCYYYVKRSGSIISKMNKEYNVNGLILIDVAYSNYCIMRENDLSEQANYALLEYINSYLKNYCAIEIMNKQYCKEYKLYKSQFIRYVGKIIRNDKVCKMKKVVAIMSLLSSRMTYTIIKKYFPECLFEYMW